MTEEYLKYKERTPGETILLIRQILQSAGLFPVLKWTGEDGTGCFSNRITLYPTPIGVNGKGTDEMYSTASGFGELIERLQNNILLSGPCEGDPEREGAVLFSNAPDEEAVPLEEVLKHPDPFTSFLLDGLAGEDESSNGEALLHLLGWRKNGREVLTAVPFADPANHRTVMVPVFVARYFTGTNGMAAGNTLEEAIVQGLSELLEREVNARIMNGEAVPPEIPEEVLRQSARFPLLEQLRKNDRYRIRFLDCSLGKGWPVAGLCIQDLVKGTFGIRLGAHPSFQVAVERTITEALQGNTARVFAGQSRAGSVEDATSCSNISNISQYGHGLYPASLFYREPDWEFKPWTGFSGGSNASFLKEMLGMLSAEGYHPLIRDCSFLGFPACYILIPGFITPRELSGHSVRYKRTIERAAEDFRHFPKLNDAEALRMLRLIRHNENEMADSLVSTLSGIPVHSPLLSNRRIGAFLALRLGDFATASRMFGRAVREAADPGERKYLSCMQQYAAYRSSGLDQEKAQRLIREIYQRETAERVCGDTADLSAVMEKCFEKMRCPDCSGCGYRKDCCYTDSRDLYLKVCAAMKKENVSQEKLLKILENL